MIRRCEFCRRQIPNEVKYCPFCGKYLEDAPTELLQENMAPVQNQFPQQQAGSQSADAGAGRQYQNMETKWQTIGGTGKSTKKTPLIISLVCGLTLALLLTGGFLWPGFFRGGNENPTVALHADSQQAEPAGTSRKRDSSAANEAAAPERSNPFQDMTRDDQYYESCLWAYERGILQGDTANAKEAITRADVLMYLWRAMGSPDAPERECPFSDVQPEDAWYKAVLWGLDQKVISHRSESFKPLRTANRAETTAMLYQAKGAEDVDHAPLFIDTSDSAWYTDPITWACLNGILDQDSSCRFYPKDTLERGRFLRWLFRAVDPEHAPATIPAKRENFQELGISVNLTVGGKATLLAFPKDDPNRQIPLSVRAQSYEVFSGRENYPAREGYLWHMASFLVSGDGTDLKGLSFKLMPSLQDANNVLLFWQEQSADESGDYTSWICGEDGSVYDVLFKPIECENAANAVCIYTAAVRIPEGYDGLCFCLCDGTKSWGSKKSLADVYTGEEEFVLFRMD